MKIFGRRCKVNVDFVNAMLLNWPSLKYLTIRMDHYRHFDKDLKFLENVKFEHCERLECVEVETLPDMTRQFFSKDEYYYYGPYIDSK